MAVKGSRFISFYSSFKSATRLNCGADLKGITKEPLMNLWNAILRLKSSTAALRILPLVLLLAVIRAFLGMYCWVKQ